MKRLTVNKMEYHKAQDLLQNFTCKDCELCGNEIIMCSKDVRCCAITQAVGKLRKYEDTGLSPENVSDMIHLVDSIRDSIALLELLIEKGGGLNGD